MDAVAQNFDVRERTILSRTDNTSALYWQRRGSTTTTKCTAQLLRLFGIHQRHHRYVPRHDFIPGQMNTFADKASRLFSLTDSEFLSYFNTHHPQTHSYKLWSPSKQMLSAVITALRNKTSVPESVLVVPALPGAIGNNGNVSRTSWPSTPFSKPSKTKYPSFKSLLGASGQDNYHPAAIPSALERLKTTYGRLAKRSWSWA